VYTSDNKFNLNSLV